jgi:hypothetical protein
MLHENPLKEKNTYLLFSPTYIAHKFSFLLLVLFSLLENFVQENRPVDFKLYIIVVYLSLSLSCLITAKNYSLGGGGGDNDDVDIPFCMK